jgi:hypothetical protein
MQLNLKIDVFKVLTFEFSLSTDSKRKKDEKVNTDQPTVTDKPS